MPCYSPPFKFARVIQNCSQEIVKGGIYQEKSVSISTWSVDSPRILFTTYLGSHTTIVALDAVLLPSTVLGPGYCVDA